MNSRESIARTICYNKLVATANESLVTRQGGGLSLHKPLHVFSITNTEKYPPFAKKFWGRESVESQYYDAARPPTASWYSPPAHPPHLVVLQVPGRFPGCSRVDPGLGAARLRRLFGFKFEADGFEKIKAQARRGFFLPAPLHAAAG